MTLAEAIADDPTFADYPGSKGQEYVWKRIVTRMPRHAHYVELFAGACAVGRNKLPALCNTLVEKDVRISSALRTAVEAVRGVHWHVECGDAVAWLKAQPALTESTLIYADPPYPFVARSQMAMIYDTEFGTDEQHRELIFHLQRSGARVMLSGYRCDLYDNLLQSWVREDYQTATRGGVVTESLWTNFDPAGLTKHDLRFVGKNFRDRHRIKRKATRWVANFRKLPDDERQAIFEALTSTNLV